MEVNAKRGRPNEEDEYSGPVQGAGRGTGRPPGSSQGLQVTLNAIQAQLALQTTKMGLLAQKEDVLEVS